MNYTGRDSKRDKKPKVIYGGNRLYAPTSNHYGSDIPLSRPLPNTKRYKDDLKKRSGVKKQKWRNII